MGVGGRLLAESGILQHSDEIVQNRTGSAESEILSASQPEQANLLQTVQEADPSTELQQRAQNRIFVRLLLAPKNELKLKELQKKLSRKQKAPVDLNEVVEILLDVYEKRAEISNRPKSDFSLLAAAVIMPWFIRVSRLRSRIMQLLAYFCGLYVPDYLSNL